MLCEDAPGQILTMYICPVTNVLGQMPLIPCYMDGQKHPTIPYRFRKSHLREAIADSRLDNGTGSRLYEVNIWVWNYGRSLTWPISASKTIKTVTLIEGHSRKGLEMAARIDIVHSSFARHFSPLPGKQQRFQFLTLSRSIM